MTQQIAIKASVDELCANRAKAIEGFLSGVELIRQATADMQAACVGTNAVGSKIEQVIERSLKGWSDNKDLPEKVRIEVDRAMWRSFVIGTPLWGLMDATARAQFEKDMEGVPPEASPNNLRITMEGLFAESDMIFRRGLVEVFRGLCREYRSNNGFRLGKRIVMTGVQTSYGSLNSYRDDSIRDLDRIFYVLDGREPPTSYNEGLRGALAEAIRTASSFSPGAGAFETDYFRVKFFKNGNAQFYFLRPDLVEKANRIIAEFYGETLGAGPDAAGAKRKADPAAGRKDTWSEDFYPTPADTAERMADLADIDDGMTVCEPSAGKGALVDALLETPAASITAVEKNAGRADFLTERYAGNPRVMTRRGDWLDPDTGRYDRIVMNPPYSSGQWIRNLLVAWERLAPGGRLVALVPNGTGTGPGALKAKAAALIRQAALVEDVPAGAFKAAGTMISTRIVVLDKPEDPA
ncbi:MAG: DUF4942 domain-containing protein [Acetobacter aceti]